jgi:hypothetical protein
MKRFLCAFAAVIVLTFSQAGPVFAADGVIMPFLNDKKEPLDAFWAAAESEYTDAYAYIGENGDGGVLVLCAYDAERRLINVSFGESGGNGSAAHARIYNGDGGSPAGLRAFLWDGVSSMKPLAATAETKAAVMGSLVFNSGFEAGSYVSSRSGNMVYISGADASVTAPNHWYNDFIAGSKFGLLAFQYENGQGPSHSPEATQYVDIADDPTQSESPNKALVFSVLGPRNGPADSAPYSAKERVQMNVYKNSAELSEVYYKFKMYLNGGFATLKKHNDTFSDTSKDEDLFHFLTVAEFWNQRNWASDGVTPPYPFRLSLDIKKTETAANSENLYFTLIAQTAPAIPPRKYFNMVWEVTNTEVPVPIGEWVDCEIWYKQGDGENGRFYYAITPENGEKQVVFNETNWTYNPGNPSPDGMREFNPLKLYVHRALIDSVSKKGTDADSRTLKIYWDDIEFYTND